MKPVGGHSHGLGRHAISTTHLEGLSARSWLFIALAVFVVLSTLDLERRLHSHSNTVSDEHNHLPKRKHAEVHGRSSALASKGSNDKHKKPARESSYELSESNDWAVEQDVNGQREGEVKQGEEEAESWNLEDPNSSAELQTPLPKSGKGKREATGIVEIPRRDRSMERAVKLREEVERKRQEQLERMKYDAISAGSEADRGTETCEACHWHGMCTFDGDCICASLWSGKFCETVVRFQKPKVMENFNQPYALKDFAMTSRNLHNESSIWATKNPGQSNSQVIKLADVTRSLLRALPEEDPLGNIIFKSCAVVGSSGILLMYDQGALIDAHDAVIRFNSAPTKGFEAKVGSRSTLRITNSRNFGFREHPSEQVYQHMRVAAGLQKLLSIRRRQPHLLLYGMHPSFHEFIDKGFDGFLATSGLVGVIMAMHKCAKVDLYGFQVHPRHGVQYHYYNQADTPANEGRDDVEWLAIKAMVSAGLVTFGEPCIVECHTSELWCENCQKALEVAGG